jgi:hypothetical protein
MECGHPALSYNRAAKCSSSLMKLPDQLLVVGTHLFELDSLTILTHPHAHASRINVLTPTGAVEVFFSGSGV